MLYTQGIPNWDTLHPPVIPPPTKTRILEVVGGGDLDALLVAVALAAPAQRNYVVSWKIHPNPLSKEALPSGELT
jgi:hypothetical protein